MVEPKEILKNYTDKQELRETRIIRQSCFKAACDAYEWDHDIEDRSQIRIILSIARAGEEYVSSIASK
jgi:hypothetical protein